MPPVTEEQKRERRRLEAAKFRRLHHDRALEIQRASYWRNRKSVRERDRAWRQAIKREVLVHYSGSDPPKCVRCGFPDLRALQLDHIVAIRRKRRGQTLMPYTTGSMYYLTLKRNGWPEGFQVLCANCNWIKRAENGETRRRVV